MFGALRQEGETDYRLEDDQQSCWISVGNISVYVRRTDEGVAVDLYPLGQEMYDSIVGTWALFSEAEEYIEDEHGDRTDRRGTLESWSRLNRQGQDGQPRGPKGGD